MPDFPLRNKTIITTNQASDNRLQRFLEKKKARVIPFPLIEIVAADLSVDEKALLEDINEFDALVFTSKNGIRYFFKYIADNRMLLKSHMRFYVIGEATANELKKYKREAHLVNPGNTAKEFLPFLLNSEEIKGQKILFVLGNLAPDTLVNGLKVKAETARINIYETRMPKDWDADIVKKISENTYDLITFTSPSAFLNLLKTDRNFIKPEKLKAACIGKRTEGELLKHGCKPLLTASIASSKVLAQETEQYFSNR